MSTTPLVITPGDPVGVGPEVSVRALLDAPPTRPVVLAGHGEAIREAARIAGLSIDGHRVRLHDTLGGAEPPEVAALRWGTAACLAGEADALVTGPIHKERLARHGFPHPGHTDFLGVLCGVERPVMAFVGGALRVALVTVHLPLRAVPDAVTTDGVLHTTRTAHEALVRQLGLDEPRLLVCGLNPHAGDGGLLGTEDAEVVAPAVEAARALGIHAEGPMSIETAVRRALAGDGDLIVAMYHDQGLAPLKAVDFGRSVNWTLGLPIVRTSVDHGTADDIAGKGLADASSMIAALQLAEQLADRRR